MVFNGYTVSLSAVQRMKLQGLYLQNNFTQNHLCGMLDMVSVYGKIRLQWTTVSTFLL